MPVVDPVTMQASRPGVYFGGDSAFGPKNIIWAVAHAHEAAISIHNHCSGVPVTQRPPQGMNLITPEDGAGRVELQQRLQPGQAREDEARRPASSGSRSSPSRWSWASIPSRPRARSNAASTATCRRCSRTRSASSVTPASTSARRRCLTIAPNGEEDDLRKRLTVVAAEHHAGPVRVRRAAADRSRHGEGRRRVRALRPVRRALPDGGVGHAEVRSPDSLTRAMWATCNVAWNKNG